MDIYVVQPGDTIYSIADRYGVDVAKLVLLIVKRFLQGCNLLMAALLYSTVCRKTSVNRQYDPVNEAGGSFIRQKQQCSC
ncbi:MAG: LysM domain [Herbinix sp.]|nr:LysM domain [Herbinix sp.]